MNNLERIMAKRAALIAQAAAQRADLAVVYGQFQRPAAILDKGYAIARGIKAHSGLVIGAAATLMLFRPGSIGKLARYAMRAASFATPMMQSWLSRKLSRKLSR